VTLAAAQDVEARARATAARTLGLRAMGALRMPPLAALVERAEKAAREDCPAAASAEAIPTMRMPGPRAPAREAPVELAGKVQAMEAKPQLAAAIPPMTNA
jgi:hypothetical protein